MPIPILAASPAPRDLSAELSQLGGFGADLFGKSLAQGQQFATAALALDPALAKQERLATRWQRRADLHDLENLGGGYMEALQGIDPAWAQGLGAIGTELGQLGGSPLLGQLNADAGAGYQPDAVAQRLSSSALGAGPSALRTELERQALGDLQLGRFLSPAQQRDAEQAARQAYADRGLAFSPGAIGAEILNRDQYATAREAQRRGFAADTQGLAQREDESIFNRLLGAEQSSQAGLGAFRNFALGVQGANAQQDAGRRGFVLGATQTAQAALNPVLGMFSQRTPVSPGAGAQILGAGTSAAQQGMQPLMSYGSDLFNTNFNAAAATNFANTKAMNDFGGAVGAGSPAFFDGFGIYHGQGSGGGFCWVAREVLKGEEEADGTPKWEQFRDYLLTEADPKLRDAYGRHGEQLAEYLKEHPDAAAALRPLFADIVDARATTAEEAA